MTPRAESWSESVGSAPNTVWVGERPEKDGDVYLRWSERRWNDAKGKHVHRSRYLKAETQDVRDPRGRLLSKRVAAAIAEAQAKHDELVGGAAPKRTRPLTLAEGVAMAFTDRGPFPKRDARYWQETKKRLDLAVTLLGGPDRAWADLTPGMLRSVWRQIHARQAAKGNPGQGANKAEKVLTNLQTALSFLEVEFPHQHFPRLPRHWRKEIHTYWAEQGHKVVKHQPKHTEAEAVRLMSAANLRAADPRVRLALGLGARLRGGQLIRTMRSAASLPRKGGRRPRDPLAGGTRPLGLVRVPWESPRKKAPVLALNVAERLVLERAIRRGHLSDLEAAYQAGEIQDYALWPQGKMSAKGKATRPRSERSMDKRTLNTLFHDYERACGVTPVDGRAWHGLRRLYGNLDDERSEAGESVKDELGGWTLGSDTRKDTYLDRQSQARAEAAARVRRQVRPRKEGEADV